MLVDIKISFTVFPRFQEIYNENLKSQNLNIRSKFAKANNIEITNFYLYFFEIPFDIHFNKNGNKLIPDNFLKKFLNKTNDKN